MTKWAVEKHRERFLTPSSVTTNFTVDVANQGWRLYAVTNQVTATPEPAAAGLPGLAALGLLRRRRQANLLEIHMNDR